MKDDFVERFFDSTSWGQSGLKTDEKNFEKRLKQFGLNRGSIREEKGEYAKMRVKFLYIIPLDQKRYTSNSSMLVIK